METYKFAIETVREAGELLLNLRSKNFKVTHKNKNLRDIVTSVDKELEKFIVKKIRTKYPSHGIYSEEGASLEGDDEYMWAIDPIDGTANFSRAIPHFAVCLALLFKEEPILGVVFNPVTNELFSFEKGKGALLNGKKIKVSKYEILEEAYVLFHAGRKKEFREWGGESYKRLLDSAKKTSNLASSALDTCFVAAGRVEANIYGTLSTLDIASAIGILKEAGGIVEGGNDTEVVFDAKAQKIYMTNNKKMLKSLKKLL